MKINKVGSSLIEALVVIVILSMWIVATYSFFSKSISFLDWLSSRIEAIEIAREWIEALENIRNTNLILFEIDRNKCWDVFNYKEGCIIWDPSAEKIPWDNEGNKKTYILKNNNWRWELESKNNWNFTDIDFRNNFAVWKDKKTWKYCQPVSPDSPDSPDCIKMKWNFTRKIEVYKKDKDKMIVKSIVEWIDSSTSNSRKVELYNLLTNH